MKVTILCPNVSSNALVRTFPIARVLERAHTVEVLGFRFGDGVFPPYRDAFEYDVVAARPNPVFWAQVRALAGRIETDAIYAFKPLPSSLWVGLLASRRLGVPLFLDIEDWEYGWYLDAPLSSRLKHLAHVEHPNGLVWTRLSEFLIPRCDGIFVVSRFLQQRFGGTILRHGTDTDFFDPSKYDRAEARGRLGLPDGPLAIFTGSPMRNKGLDDFLGALELLGRPAVRLLVVGSFAHDPEYRTHLEGRFGDRILFVGPRPHAEMPAYLAAADLVVVPQRVSRETIAQVPGKVFEAMAMAKPVLATRVGDLPEILDGCAALAEPGSIEDIARATSDLLDDPRAAQRMGSEARTRCVRRYSWDAMAEVLEAGFAAAR